MKTFEEWNITNIFGKKPPPPNNPEDQIDPYGEEDWSKKEEVFTTTCVDFFNEKIRANEYIAVFGKYVIEGVRYSNEIFKILSFTTRNVIMNMDETHIYIKTIPNVFTVYWPLKDKEIEIAFDGEALQRYYSQFRDNYLQYETMFSNIKKHEENENI